MSSRNRRYSDFTVFLERFENSRNKDPITKNIRFNDIIADIISRNCCPSLKKDIIYRPCVAMSECINGILIGKKNKTAVCIRYCRDNKIPLSDIDVPLCLKLCGEQNINNVLIVTNAIKIDPTIKRQFESSGVLYNELTREDLSNISPSNINKISPRNSKNLKCCIL